MRSTFFGDGTFMFGQPKSKKRSNRQYEGQVVFSAFLVLGEGK